MSQPPEPQGRPYGRGAFLLLVAGGLSSLAWASPALRLLDSLLPGGAKALLPSQGWRIYTIGDSMPRFDPRSWRLRIDGLVARPRALSYEELLRLPRAEQTANFHCVTGWTVKDVRWAGVRFHDLLALARPLPEAHALRFDSAEVPYEDTLTLEQAGVVTFPGNSTNAPGSAHSFGNPFRYAASWEVTGGTGRFAGAHGTGTSTLRGSGAVLQATFAGTI